MQGFTASEIDTTRPHPARMYDAYLRGKDNYPVDREAVRQILRQWPEVRLIAQANRAFLQRAVRFLAGKAGIRQFIDIGTGIPAAGNVHEVAAQVAPDARVVYIDKIVASRVVRTLWTGLVACPKLQTILCTRPRCRAMQPPSNAATCGLEWTGVTWTRFCESPRR